MVESEILGIKATAAILAGEGIAQEDVEAGKGRPALEVDILLQGDHAGQHNFPRGRMYRHVVFGNRNDSFQEHRLDRILPAPERQREITEWAKIRIQHQGRISFGGNRHANKPFFRSVPFPLQPRGPATKIWD